MPPGSVLPLGSIRVLLLKMMKFVEPRMWMPCWLPSQVSPVKVLVALFSTQTVAPSDRRIFATAAWMWSEKTSVSSTFEYWMLLTWQLPVVPSARCELAIVRTVPLGARSLMSSHPSRPPSDA